MDAMEFSGRDASACPPYASSQRTKPTFVYRIGAGPSMSSPFTIIGNIPVPPPSAHPRPSWLRVKFFGGPKYQELKRTMRTLDLHTVCESARCPNMGECWEHGTATFMILGNICTRACGFCAVPSGKPL